MCVRVCVSVCGVRGGGGWRHALELFKPAKNFKIACSSTFGLNINITKNGFENK